MSAKRQALIEQGNRLFHQHGIRRVSVEEICRQAQCSKVTFYKHFDNKLELALLILERNFHEMIEAQDAILKDEQLCFADKFHRMMRLDREQMQAMGSPLLEDIFSSELPEIQAFLQRLMDEHKERCAEFFRAGQAAGLFNPHVPIELFFYLQQQMMSLFQDPQLQAILPEPTQRTEAIADILTFGIMKPSETETASSV